MDKYIELTERDNEERSSLKIPLHEQKSTGIKPDYPLRNDKEYGMSIFLRSDTDLRTSRIKVYINEQLIDCRANIGCDEDIYYFNLSFDGYNFKKLFVLCYDVVNICVEVQCDDISLEYVSDSLICFSSYRMDASNIEHIVMTLLNNEDEEINNLLFRHSCTPKTSYGSLEESTGKQSLSSFVSYVQDVVKIYKQCFPKFKVNAKHKLSQNHRITDYSKVSNVSPNSITWLVKNLNVLQEVERDGILIGQSNYLPSEIISSQFERDFNIYENQIIVGLLENLKNKVSDSISQYRCYIEAEERLINSLDAISQEYYTSPLISIRTKFLDKIKENYYSLRDAYDQLGLLYKRYSEVLKCSGIKFNSIPVKTKVFSELAHYKVIYNLIVKYEMFSAINYDKETIISSVRTIDRLYEYYCLLTLLDTFREYGCTLERSVLYPYSLGSMRHEFDRNVANTYYISHEKYNIRLFYEPILYNYESKTTNGIRIFRTTDFNRNYYCPDFLISFESIETGQTHYVILDAKYSTRFILRQHGTLFSSIKKYFLELDTYGGDSRIEMIWLLQGKADSEADVEYYHNSEMSRLYAVRPNCAIFNMNIKNQNLYGLFDELSKYINL